MNVRSKPDDLDSSHNLEFSVQQAEISPVRCSRDLSMMRSLCFASSEPNTLASLHGMTLVLDSEDQSNRMFFFRNLESEIQHATDLAYAEDLQHLISHSPYHQWSWYLNDEQHKHLFLL